jgi:hypothetical protein
MQDRNIQPGDIRTLDNLVDRTGLQAVVLALASIANDRANRARRMVLRQQIIPDDGTGNTWDRDALRLMRVAGQIEN